MQPMKHKSAVGVVGREDEKRETEREKSKIINLKFMKINKTFGTNVTCDQKPRKE